MLCSLITFAAARRRTLSKISSALSLSSMHSIQSVIYRYFCWNKRVSTSTNVSETIPTNFLETFFSDLAQRRVRTCIVIFILIEKRRSTSALEEKIASQVSWTFDGISNFNAVSLASAAMLCTKSRECSKDKSIIVNEDAELLVQRRENHPSPRLFVLTLVLCEKIRRQLCHQGPDERRHLPAPVLLERNLAGERVELQHHCLIKMLPFEALRFAKQVKLHCISSHRMFVLLRLFWTASRVFCVNCERVKLPPFSPSWAEAISCQHQT